MNSNYGSPRNPMTFLSIFVKFHTQRLKKEKDNLKLSKVGSLDIRQGTIQIKKCHTVTYLGCSLDKNLPGESMVLKVINKN